MINDSNSDDDLKKEGERNFSYAVAVFTKPRKTYENISMIEEEKVSFIEEKNNNDI